MTTPFNPRHRLAPLGHRLIDITTVLIVAGSVAVFFAGRAGRLSPMVAAVALGTITGSAVMVAGCVVVNVIRRHRERSVGGSSDPSAA